MSDKAQETRAQIAAKHLVGNLWYNLEDVPLIAAKLNPVTMATVVGGPAALAYGEMCRLLRAKDERLSSGQLEANLKQGGFNFNTLASWQADLTNDSIDDLYQYVTEIQNAADLYELKNNLVDTLKKTNEPDARAERLKAELLAGLVRADRPDGGPRHVADILDDVQGELDLAREGLSEWGASTGLHSLDKVFRLVDGNYITLGARPSQGKTSLAMWIAYKRAEQLKRSGEDGQVLIFSLDDTERKVVRSLACSVAMVDNNRLKNRQATAKEWADMDDARGRIELLPIWIDETPGLTSEEIHYRTAMQNVKAPVRLLVIDYIEKIKAPQFGGDNDLSRLRYIADNCKNLGKVFSCPVLMLSQMTKEVEKRADKWPTSSDLKYAGEEESDVIILLNRPEHYISKGEHIDCDDRDKSGIVLVNVAKNKEGNVGLVRLAFKKEHSRFADLHVEVRSLNE